MIEYSTYINVTGFVKMCVIHTSNLKILKPVRGDTVDRFEICRYIELANIPLSSLKISDLHIVLNRLYEASNEKKQFPKSNLVTYVRSYIRVTIT